MVYGPPTSLSLSDCESFPFSDAAISFCSSSSRRSRFTSAFNTASIAGVSSTTISDMRKGRERRGGGGERERGGEREGGERKGGGGGRGEREEGRGMYYRHERRTIMKSK